MAEFIKNRPFRFWCQKVLPLVYDDSLSYYELLCKVVCKLNELAENQNNLSDEIKQVAQDLNDFKNQVPGMIEAKVQEWLDNYIATHGLVNSVNGMTGVVTLTAANVGAIANVNGSVKNNNIADGAITTEKIADGAVTGDKIAGKAITANKLADGVIPEKLPNPQKLTFSGGATGEYDGSEAVNINIPAGGGGGGNAPLTFTGAVDATYDGTEAVTVDIPRGGGGGGAVDSVNGMTGTVVLKKLTAVEGLSMSGEDGYNGSAEQSVGIAPGGVSGDKIADNAITSQKIANDAVTADKIAGGAITSDKMASGVIPTKLPNPQKLTFSGAVTGEYDGSAEVNINIPNGGGGGAVNSVNGMTGDVVLKKLTFTGGATGTYDGSEALSVDVPKDAYYTRIAETADNKGTKWYGILTGISKKFGVLYLRTDGSPSTGTHTLAINMTTEFSGSDGTAAVVASGESTPAGTASVLIVTNKISVTFYLSKVAPTVRVTIPVVKTM